jgi:protein-tyrosine kinase
MKLRKALDKIDPATRLTVISDGRPQVIPQPSIVRPPQKRTRSRSKQVPFDAQCAKTNRCICLEPESPEGESFKILRAKIQQLALKNNQRTVLITSPQPGDGKTLISTNLALSFAKGHDQTVLLVDCDLKHQNLHQRLGIENSLGIINHLVDDTPLEEIIIRPGIEKLSIISGGEPVSNTAEELGSARMKALIGELKARYADRIVLFDAPPVLSGADTLSLAQFVDAIVLVVSDGKTSLKDLRKTMEVLPREKLLGFVLNRQQTDNLQNYYQ